MSPGVIWYANIKMYLSICRHCRNANLKNKNVTSLEYLHFHLGIHRHFMVFMIFLTSHNDADVLETKLYSKRKQPKSWLYYWKQKTICIQQLYLDSDIWNKFWRLLNSKEVFCDPKATYSPLVAWRLLLLHSSFILGIRQSCNRNSAATQCHLQYTSFNFSFDIPKTVNRIVDISFLKFCNQIQVVSKILSIQ